MMIIRTIKRVLIPQEHRIERSFLAFVFFLQFLLQRQCAKELFYRFLFDFASLFTFGLAFVVLYFPLFWVLILSVPLTWASYFITQDLIWQADYPLRLQLVSLKRHMVCCTLYIIFTWLVWCYSHKRTLRKIYRHVLAFFLEPRQLNVRDILIWACVIFLCVGCHSCSFVFAGIFIEEGTFEESVPLVNLHCQKHTKQKYLFRPCLDFGLPSQNYSTGAGFGESIIYSCDRALLKHMPTLLEMEKEVDFLLDDIGHYRFDCPEPLKEMFSLQPETTTSRFYFKIENSQLSLFSNPILPRRVLFPFILENQSQSSLYWIGVPDGNSWNAAMHGLVQLGFLMFLLFVPFLSNLDTIMPFWRFLLM